MSGSLGEFLVRVDAGGSPLPAQRLMKPSAWPGWRGAEDEIAYAAPAPGVQVWARGAVAFESLGGLGGLGVGIDPAGHQAVVRAALRRWATQRVVDTRTLKGRYALVWWDASAGHVAACTDAFRTYPLYYARSGSAMLVASDARLLLATGEVTRKPCLPALYHYLNFSYVPAPYSALEGIAKLPAGSLLQATAAAVELTRYWDAEYPEDISDPVEQRAAELRRRIVDTVTGYRPNGGTRWGTFLSGGTDSSSIASILARAVAPGKVSSFSIGFEEAGYDELSYSRLASERFGLEAHERRVGEAEAVAAIPRLVEAFDEPFGNSSAIPTYYCADLAAQHGVSVLVAGDGGDEIYGGNERYRKDRIFGAFYRSPWIVRRAGRAAAGLLAPVDTRWANRIKNFVERGSLANPDRFYSDDSFASDQFDELLSEEFRQCVARDDSLDLQRRIFHEARAGSELHRLMYLDLKMTIADNDVVKVVRASRTAGVSVMFPYLDRELVNYTGRLPSTDKVQGLEKRFLFKKATQDILPPEIRKKKKQGFGLPVSVWLRRNGPFREMARDVLFSSQCRQRGYFQPAHVEALMRRHERGAWDHAAEIYMLLMLELWHRKYVDKGDE